MVPAATPEELIFYLIVHLNEGEIGGAEHLK
jgi:hypothetical protein